MLGDQDTKQGWEPKGPRNLVEKGTTQKTHKDMRTSEEGQRTGEVKRDANEQNASESGASVLDANQGATDPKAGRFTCREAWSHVQYASVSNRCGWVGKRTRPAQNAPLPLHHGVTGEVVPKMNPKLFR